MEKLEVKPYEFDRDKEVISLLHRVFNPWSGGEAYFKWKYHQLQLPDSSFPRGWIIERNGKIIAFNGYIPRKIKVAEKEIYALQSFDTVTEPECRGQGLFGILQKLVYEEIQKTDIPWIYGWTSEIGFKVFTQKVGWTVWGQQKYLLRLLDPSWFAQSKMKNKLLADCIGWTMSVLHSSKGKDRQWLGRICEEKNFPKEVDDLCNTWENRFDIIARRNKNYLDWRHSNPLAKEKLLCAYNNNDELVGYLVHSVESADELDILDCVWSEASALSALLDEVECYGRQNGFRIIRFRVTEDKQNTRCFKDAGYFYSRTTFPMVGHCVSCNERLRSLLWKQNKSIYWSLFDRNE